MQKEISLEKMDRVDHKKLMKRAEEGLASYKDLYTLMKGDLKKRNNIPLSDIRVILRRLGLNLTQHRIAELIAASKQARLHNTVGAASMEINSVNLDEFPFIFEFMQKTIFSNTLDALAISTRSLTMFTLVSFGIFLINLNYISNVVTKVFGGGLEAAGLCAIVPLGNESFELI